MYPKFSKEHSTRPEISIFELSAVITSLARSIYESKDLKKYTTTTDINDLVNPAYLATKLLFEGKFDADIIRDSETVKFSELYVNPRYKELLLNYFERQQNVIHSCVIDKLL